MLAPMKTGWVWKAEKALLSSHWLAASRQKRSAFYFEFRRAGGWRGILIGPKIKKSYLNCPETVELEQSGQTGEGEIL